MVSDLALSGANAPALPKGEPLAVPADCISLPRPLPWGEVDLRSKDGEGEQAKVKVSANNADFLDLGANIKRTSFKL